GILALRVSTGSFDFSEVQTAFYGGQIPAWAATLALVGFVAGFGVKSPLVPLHTWLPDVYRAAPTGGVVLLSGAMAKLGTYGFLRFVIEMMPREAARIAPGIVWLSVVGIVYAAWIAATQRDIKRVIAFSSISHIGYILAGLFSGNGNAVAGAVLQMVNHGIVVGALFLIAGVIEDRWGTVRTDGLGGIWQSTPVLGRIFLIVVLASAGLPLTNGFVGEFLILVGLFDRFPAPAIVGATGAIWSAVYLLTMFRAAAYGQAKQRCAVPDLDGRERLLLGATVVLIFLLGVVPSPLLRMFREATPVIGITGETR
ncbi:MAG: NuoM family protein, partial [Armatimonadota bacterium]